MEPCLLARSYVGEGEWAATKASRNKYNPYIIPCPSFHVIFHLLFHLILHYWGPQFITMAGPSICRIMPRLRALSHPTRSMHPIAQASKSQRADCGRSVWAQGLNAVTGRNSTGILDTFSGQRAGEALSSSSNTLRHPRQSDGLEEV